MTDQIDGFAGNIVHGSSANHQGLGRQRKAKPGKFSSGIVVTRPGAHATLSHQ